VIAAKEHRLGLKRSQSATARDFADNVSDPDKKTAWLRLAEEWIALAQRVMPGSPAKTTAYGRRELCSTGLIAVGVTCRVTKAAIEIRWR
jgi:hypothetical protein